MHPNHQARLFRGKPKYCKTGKVCFGKKDAQTSKNSRYKAAHVKLRIYQCPICGYWHLTSKRVKR